MQCSLRTMGMWRMKDTTTSSSTNIMATRATNAITLHQLHGHHEQQQQSPWAHSAA